MENTKWSLKGKQKKENRLEIGNNEFVQFLVYLRALSQEGGCFYSVHVVMHCYLDVATLLVICYTRADELCDVGNLDTTCEIYTIHDFTVSLGKDNDG